MAGAPVPRVLVVSAWLLAALACQPEQTADTDFNLLEGLSVTEAGAVSEAAILPWRLSPSLRVGYIGQDDDQQFVEVSAATVLRDGRILVADAQTGLVRLYGPDGDFLDRLGSRGRGPGEFQSPSSLLLVPGDSVCIWDRTLWRMSVFSPEGEFVRSERYDPTAAGLYPVQGMWPEVVRLSGEGSRLIRLISKGNAKLPGAGDPDLVGLAVHRRGDSRLDLIQVLPREELVEVEAPWGPTLLPPPLAAGPRITLDGQGEWACVGHQATPELLCVDSAGRRIGLRWSSPPRSVWPEDPAIGRWLDETVNAYSGKISGSDVRAMISAVPVPSFYPAFRELLFDTLGYLWVGLGPSTEGTTESEYLVFGPEFRLEGRVVLPMMTVVEIGADYVLGIGRDTLGVEEVMVLTISRQVAR